VKTLAPLQATCIYCGEPADSKEDWLPRGFGTIKGITLLKDRLCQTCNNALGREVDQEVLKTGLTGMLRGLLQIEGRHGVPSPNPFHYKVMGAESATTMLMPCDHGDYQLLGDPFIMADGSAHTYPLRQLVFRRPDWGMVPVPFPPGYDGRRLRELIAKRGLEGSTLEEIYLGRHDDALQNPERDRIIREAIGHFTANVYGGMDTSSGRHDVPLSVGISLAYLRGLAKIGFHYYLWTSEIHTGAEFLFQPIRRFIRHGEGDWHSFVMLNSAQFIRQLAEGMVPEGFSHFFAVNKAQHDRLLSAVQFFVGPDHLTPPSLIFLGQTSRLIPPRCHWVSYYGTSGEKINGYNGEIKEVTDSPPSNTN
jgi:hypothetical protein